MATDTTSRPKTSRPRKGQLFVHVNSHVIRANKKNGTNEPPLVMRVYGDRSSRAYGLALLAPDGTEVGRFCYKPNQPTTCGAHVWFETSVLGCRIVTILETVATGTK